MSKVAAQAQHFIDQAGPGDLGTGVWALVRGDKIVSVVESEWECYEDPSRPSGCEVKLLSEKELRRVAKGATSFRAVRPETPRKNGKKSWWAWAFGCEIEEMTDQALKTAASQAWNTNNGDVLRACRAEAKRRGLQVA